MVIMLKTAENISAVFLYNENPAIVAGFHKVFVDEEKTNKN